MEGAAGHDRGGPVISVVIPTYNRNDLLLGRSLPSVYAQHHKELEIIVVCDGMSEESVEDLRQGISDPRVTVHNIPRQSYPDNGMNWGLYAVDARNFGLDHATAEWVSMLDDDDEMTPDNISSLLDMTRDSDTEFAYRQSMTYKNGVPTGQLYGGWPPGDGNITHGAFLMRRDLGYRYALDCYSRGLNADADLWTRMYQNAVRFRFSPGVIHHYHRSYP